jgi:VanZ family protein
MTSAEKRWLLVTLGWIGLIFFSSTSFAAENCERFYWFIHLYLPSPLIDTSINGGWMHLLAEKGVHFTLFFTFGFFVAHLVHGSPWGRLAKIAAFGLVIGSCSEFLQSFFPGRDPALRDVILNLVSASLGGVATLLWWRRAGRI